ncbi:MAG: diaminopimelate epimerase [Candidatus Eremiobacteraeota bacterium]|nr:diaminopimelate epimerase [Candidatus Eremiobacteraeota bacterium]MBV8498846.1 diaminopimelate epimerase [Candidatus Eremiobacteraeota bacterium]
MRIPLTKMHGAHNDFVILDRRVTPLRDLTSFARWVCDRHAGVGADGLIALEASTRADVRILTINADGSLAEMCGNGVRCAARWLDESGHAGPIAFESGGSVVRAEIVARAPEYLVRVDMGWPRTASPVPASIPTASFVDLGNPHVVVFERAVDALDLEALADAFQKHPAFPNGANVHLAELSGKHSVHVRHWERGVGLTQACGTGAVACAAVAILERTAASPVEVFVPGGKLVVEWDACGDARLTGPAVRVFDTEVDA